MLLFYSCNVTVTTASLWVMRAGTCAYACTCLMVLGVVPQTLTFCVKCHGLSGCLVEYHWPLDLRRTWTSEPF